ncbi:hydantoinase B/oxoprolinase family protein [Baekduia soli]|uniref:Hydantoinase B/oxoprolinase family protein n=1 Tax=Baekduia soli TaxID=496014 RepID=A0A5B8U3D1_9ACTN|nr:hydantoinase B/oxoprolinase family protein [Baekduia soli]QEC47378.1 hydantoinase B/oxoprolinase family protein [Baekduia soli]
MAITPDVAFDPITYEVISHRLWSINEEGSTTIAHASGSPVVQATDYNFALYAPNGDLAVSGVFYMLPVFVMQMMIKKTIELYGDELRPGDVFITNDPFTAGVHQSDVQFVSPFFEGDRLVGWTGCMAHVMDVGGMNPGSWCPTATELSQEGLLVPLQRIVDRGKIVQGLWDLIMSNSRLPAMLANDFSAMLSSHRVAQTRLAEACDQYGADAIVDVMQHAIERTEAQMREWVRELPDGEFEHVGFVDHDGQANNLYKVACRLTKKDDTLTFDFTGTDDAIIGFGNASAPGTYGAIGTAIIAIFGSKLNWNAGLMRPVVVNTPQNSVISAEPPRPISGGSVTAAWIAAAGAMACTSKMLAFREEYHEFVMGPPDGSWLLTQFGGVNQFGEPFAVMFMDPLAWGGPAMSTRDGVSTGGCLAALGGGFNDVELHESQHPLLYLWRRENPDSGGAGRYRGGNGIELALAVYDSPGIMSICGTQGAVVPSCIGVFGALPGSTCLYDVVADSDWRERYAAGESIHTLDDMSGTRSVPDAKTTVMMGPTDVVNNLTQNAGGHGDPLDRPPAEVLDDVLGGHVTLEGARERYGVVVDGHAVDEAATTAKRDELRRARLAEATGGAGDYEVGSDLPVVERWGGVLNLLRSGDGIVVQAADSGAVLGPLSDEGWRHLVPSRTLSAWDVGPQARIDDRLEVRQYLDPITGRSLWVDLLRIGDPVPVDFRLASLA